MRPVHYIDVQRLKLQKVENFSFYIQISENTSCLCQERSRHNISNIKISSLPKSYESDGSILIEVGTGDALPTIE